MMIYHELSERGTDAFPIGFYHLDEANPLYNMAHHWHRELEIIRVLKGSLQLKLNNIDLTVTTEDVIFVNSEIVHGAIPENCVYECLVFDPSKILDHTDIGSRFSEGLLHHNLFLFHRIRSEKKEVFEAVQEVFNSFYREDVSYQLFCFGALYRLFGILYRDKMYTDNIAYGNFLKDRNIMKLKRVIAYIQSNYAQALTLPMLAEAIEVSPKYFCTFFRQMTGRTAFEYLNAYRVEQAAKQLLISDASITEIAFGCGFNDLSYFIKTFKMYKGTTPKVFRASRYSE